MARILIVDDEENVRFSLAEALRARKHEVFEASDGNIALRTLSEQKVDVVVTDILMPNREGLETIQELRMNWPEIKIIAISGGGWMRNAELLQVARQFGADAVMKKPFSMADFTGEVGKLLDRGLWQAE